MRFSLVSLLILKTWTLLTITLFSDVCLFCQTPIGNEIIGSGPGDDFGSGVDISEDGSIVAVGMQRGYDGRGGVEVYQNNGGTWVPKGEALIGPLEYLWFGSSVGLSADGSRIVVGCERKHRAYVYDFLDGAWVKNTEFGIENGGGTGRAVDISADGSTVALPAVNFPTLTTNRGAVNIYRYIDGIWVQIGQRIEGDNDGDQFGWEVELSNDGNTVAIGAISHSFNGEDAGQVKVFQFDGTNWVQKGQTLHGQAPHLSFGWKVSISGQGQFLAVGAPIDWTGTTTQHHYVEAYEYLNGQWQIKGQTIYGNGGLNIGTDVAISENGSRLVLSSTEHKKCPVQIYDYKGGEWELVGSVSHEAEYNTLGSTLAMNPAGNVLVATSRLPNGFAILYDLTLLSAPTSCEFEEEEEEEEEEKERSLYLPNIIYLNSKNPSNSAFYAQSKDLLIYELSVFDRWGSLVFMSDFAITNKPSEGWHPALNTPTGVYLYLLKYKDGARVITKKGDFTVVK